MPNSTRSVTFCHVFSTQKHLLFLSLIFGSGIHRPVFEETLREVLL